MALVERRTVLLKTPKNKKGPFALELSRIPQLPRAFKLGNQWL